MYILLTNIYSLSVAYCHEEVHGLTVKSTHVNHKYTHTQNATITQTLNIKGFFNTQKKKKKMQALARV